MYMYMHKSTQGPQMLFWGPSQNQNNPQLRKEIPFCCHELIIFPGVWHLTWVITIVLLPNSRCHLVALDNKHHHTVLLPHSRSHVVALANKHHQFDLLPHSRSHLVALANKHHQFVLLPHSRSHLVVLADKHHCTIRLLSYPIADARLLCYHSRCHLVVLADKHH